MKPDKSYLICTTPRTGSWLLCSMLESTGVAGRPEEIFHADTLGGKPRKTIRQHLQAAVRRGTRSQRVFGGKVHWSQYRLAAQRLAVETKTSDEGLPMLLAEQLPDLTYVWLSRRDKVRQAISYYRATESGQWWRTAHDPISPCDETKFDFDTIERLHTYLVNHDANWRAYFDRLNLDPIIIHYEDLAEDPWQSTLDVLQAAGIRAPRISPQVPHLVRQADVLSESWLLKYRAAQVHAYTHGHNEDSAQPPNPAATRVAVNQTEYRIAAMQRSGHHGVINWIGGQCPGTALFLNDASPNTNPYATATILSKFENGANTRLERTLLEPHTPRSCLIYNYEDRPLDRIFTDFFEAHHDGWLGVSGSRTDIIVLRDPFNTFASRMSAGWMRYSLHDESQRAFVIEMWKSYAREALQQSTSMRHRALIIRFNQWACDRSYRQELAATLGLAFTDAGFGKVSSEYGGSSFDGTRYDGRAQQMQLTERWKKYADDPVFQSIFRDRELFELSELIFGRIPGTELLQSGPARRVIARTDSPDDSQMINPSHIAPGARTSA